MKTLLSILFVLFSFTVYTQNNVDSLFGVYTYFGPKLKLNEDVMIVGGSGEIGFAKNGAFGGIGATFNEYFKTFNDNYGCICQGISGEAPKINFYDFLSLSLLLDGHVGMGARYENMFINKREFTLSTFITYYSNRGVVFVQLGVSHTPYYDETFLYTAVFYNLKHLFIN